MRKFSTSIAVAAVVVACAPAALAQTKTWTGATSNDWSVATNWSPSGVPTATSDVLIPAGSTPVVLPGSATMRSLDLRRELSNTGSNSLISINGGGIVMQGGVISLARGSDLSFVGGAQSVTANASGGVIRTTGAGSANLIFVLSGALTIGQNVTIDASSATTIHVNAPDNGQYGTLSIQGEVRGSLGTIRVSGPLTNYIASTKTLSGGRWIIERGNINIDDNLVGTIDVDVIGANTFVSYGDVNRTATAISPLDTININLGTLEIRNRDFRAFVPPGGTFQNGGTIRINEGCRFAITNGNFRSLPGSTLEMTITGADPVLQQPRLIIGALAQFNNTGTLRIPISNPVPFDCGTSFTLFEHAGRVGTIGTIETVPSSTTVNAVYSNVPNTQIQVTGNCQGQSICDDIDFNNNGAFPEDQDVIDFFNVLAGGTCSQ
jgi:hypothetical protein